MFGRIFRGGRPTAMRPIAGQPDLHRLGEGPNDFMGLVPPVIRYWGNYQTFWAGDQIPGTGFNTSQYTYGNQTIRAQSPGLASQRQLSGGSVAQQLGAVSVGNLIDRMRAAWASTQS